MHRRNNTRDPSTESDEKPETLGKNSTSDRSQMRFYRFRRLATWKKCILLTLLTIYIIIPVTAFLFPGVASYVTLSYTFPYYFGDLQDPVSGGIQAARHVSVPTPSGDTLGLWHMLPESAMDEKDVITDSEFDARLKSGQPIIIYAHGSGGDRGQFMRVYMYATLRGQNWHVIAFDYRGFADSTGESTEANMAEDTVTVFNWVKKRAGTAPVFLWGHSLGSGVAVEAARALSAKNEAPDGLVMEGSFNNIFDLLDVAWATVPYRPFPFLLGIIKNALQRQSLTFNSDEHILHVNCPVLMVHAEDDQVVPVQLAQKLFQSAMKEKRSEQSSVVLHVFPAKKKYGHNGLHGAPDLGSVVRQFVQDTQKTKIPKNS